MNDEILNLRIKVIETLLDLIEVKLQRIEATR